MSKEFPQLGASELAWVQLLGHLQRYTTQPELIYPFKSILLMQLHLIINWFQLQILQPHFPLNARSDTYLASSLFLHNCRIKLSVGI